MHVFDARRRAAGCGFLLTMSIFAASPATAQRAVTTFVPPLERVDSLVGAEFARDSMGSITAGIVQGDQLIWTASYGFANMGARTAANRQTVYRIGSITKMFTATMLLQLATAGRLHLSDPVSRYFPEIAQIPGVSTRQAPATLLQLATMTSGLAAEASDAAAFDTGAVARWDVTLRRAIRHAAFTAQAGTHFQYSNIGYAILGAALARAAKVPYISWQEQRIFQPLGMRRTHFDIRGDLATDLAVGYVVTEGRADSTIPMREVRQGRGYRVPNGGIFTTVDDLSRFMAFALGRGPESVLPRARLDSAYTGVVATSADDDFGYGIGFMLQRRGDFPWLGHSGGVPGYQAVLYFDRDHQLGVILLRSATGGRASINRLGPDLLKMLILEKIAVERSRR
jgi:CubicO group peptidase (beta-lactamase class C family)